MPRSDDPKAIRLSRLEALRKQEGPGFTPVMPDVEAGEYLLFYLFDVGPSTAGQMLTHLEIRAWQGNTGVELQPWEVRILRRLSADYLVESRRAEDPAAQPPWEGHQARHLQSVADQMKRTIRAMAGLS